MTRLTTGLFAAAALSWLALSAREVAAQDPRWCWTCAYNLTGTKMWCEGIENEKGVVGYVNCIGNQTRTKCDIKRFDRCLPPISSPNAYVAPDGAILAEGRTDEGNLKAMHDLVSVTKGASLLASASASRVSSRAGPTGEFPALGELEQRAVVAEVLVAPGHWRVLGCDEVVRGRRYSKDAVAGLRRSSTTILL